MPPTPACAQGTTAPTARNLLATATPISPLSRSMATMENVLGWRSADNQRLQVFGIRGEDLAAVLGDDDRVGVTEAADARDVDPRFHRHDHPWGQYRLVAGREEGEFVIVDADPVPGAVDERVAQPGLLDHAPGGAVDLPAVHAGPDGGKRGLLRPQHDVEEAPPLGARPLAADRPPALSLVPVHRAARAVDDHTP